MSSIKYYQKGNSTRTNPFSSPLISIPIVLGIIGLIEVFSASRFRALELKGNQYYFAMLHAFWLLVSFVSFLATFKLSKLIKPFVKSLYLATVLVLALMFLTPAYNGAHRWIEVGGFTTFQPSEFAKIIIILFVALFIVNKYTKIRPKNFAEHFQKQLLPLGILIGIPLLLILLEPDLSTTATIAGAVFSMILFAEQKFWKHDLFLGLILGVMLVSVAVLMKPYRLKRVHTFLQLLATGEVQDKYNTGYQIYNILLGIGSGGVLGKGIGQSRQKKGYLLENTAFTDSISAVIFEELGFVLSIIFLSLYLLYILKALKCAVKLQPKHSYESFVVWGAASLIALQTIIHIFANLALIPLTGIALPFISYGGSSLLSMYTLAGLIASFCRLSS